MFLVPHAPFEEKAKSTNNELKLSPLFSDSDADLTIVSADGITFRIYSKHLETTSAGLAPPASTIIDPLEPTLLTESGAVLEVLFQFVHPRSELQQYHQPSVVDMDVSLFFAVAEAAEKYLIYGAMNICMTYMHQIYSSHPVEVLNHCAIHCHDAVLIDKAALLTISLSNPIDKALKGLKDSDIALKWMKYYSHWLQIPTLAGELWMQEETRGSNKCQRRTALISLSLRQVTGNLLSGVEDVQTSVNCSNSRVGCDCYSPDPSGWKRIINLKIQSIPKFSEII